MLENPLVFLPKLAACQLVHRSNPSSTRECVNVEMAARPEPPPNRRHKHHPLSHSATAEAEFDLCMGSEVRSVHTGCPQRPLQSHVPLAACVCVSPQPGVLAGPWEEPGTHRH